MDDIADPRHVIAVRLLRLVRRLAIIDPARRTPALVCVMPYIEGETLRLQPTREAKFDIDVGKRRLWLEVKNRVSTSLSANHTPDRRVVFVQGEDPKRTTYLHAVPGPVSGMKRAMEEANR